VRGGSGPSLTSDRVSTRQRHQAVIRQPAVLGHPYSPVLGSIVSGMVIGGPSYRNVFTPVGPAPEVFRLWRVDH
jgi:hypothetical protein